MEADEQIAIVGIGSLLPDALDADSLWSNVLAGHCALREVPAEIWDPEEFYGSEIDGFARTTSRLGGIVRGLRFSGREFGIPPSVEPSMDLTQKAALLAARAALAGVGIHGPTDGENCAVIIGNGLGGQQVRTEYVLLIMHRLLERTIETLPAFRTLPMQARAGLISDLRGAWCPQFTQISGNSLIGGLGNIIAARIAHYYNFRGPTHTVDAACASTLAALDVAVAGLRARRYDLALVGGVDFAMDPIAYIGFSRMQALSDSGSFPFDARASGFVMGEGAVVFALKRLADARRSNDYVFAVVEGIGSSSDGAGSALIAPSIKGQRLAIRRAYAEADVDPAEVAYIEAHGTATPIGDPVEILALRDTYDGCRSASIALGSVKANIGHLRAASGAAGLLRAVLAADAGVIPPQANFETPNPRCKLERSPFRIPIEPQDWPAGRVYAGVSSFGFGGINYHCLLRRPDGASTGSAVHIPRAARAAPPDARAHGVIAIGAETSEELLEAATRLGSALAAGGSPDALLAGWTEPQFASNRLAMYAPDTASAVEGLTLAIKGLRGEVSAGALRAAGVHCRSGPPARKDSLALMFPGQGSQYLGMLEGLRAEYPIVEQTLREADTILAGTLPRPLLAYLDGSQAASADDHETRFAALTQTDVLQPILVACNEAVRRALVQFCVPTIAFGHSLGEISAYIAAGVMSFEAGLRFAAARGKALVAAGGGACRGTLLQAATSPEGLQRAVGELPPDLALANKNCTRQTVIGGPLASLTLAQERLRAAGIESSFLPVSGAFHTPQMRHAVDALRTYLHEVEMFPPRLRLISSVTGDVVPQTGEPRQRFSDLLSRQVAEPVEFTTAIRNAHECGARIFIEAGPKRALCGFVDDVLAKSERTTLACCNPKEGERGSFGRMLAALVAEGLVPLRAHSRDSLRIAPLTPRVPRAPRKDRKPTGGLRQWALGRITDWLNDPQLELRLDVPLEDELGIDVIRQREFLLRLAGEAGRVVALPPRNEGFPDLQSLLAALEGASIAAREGPAPTAEPDSIRASVTVDAPAEPGPIAAGDDGQRVDTSGIAGKPLDSPSVADGILGLLMERTGYTRNELDLDAHLEQMLGIDSLAQVEIIAELQDRFRLPPDESFRVAEYPTLRKLIAYVEGKLAPAAAAPDAPPSGVQPADGSLDRPFFSRKLCLERVPMVWPHASPGRVLVLHDGNAGTIPARLVGESLSFAQGATEAVVGEALARGADAIVIVAEAAARAEDSPLRAAQRAVESAFGIGRALLRASKNARPLILISGASARHSAARAWTGAWVASWKSLCREWGGNGASAGGEALRILEIEEPLDCHIEAVMDAVNRVGPREARLGRDGTWRVPVLRRFEERRPESPSIPPVAVVTGGARGITACVAMALFEATRCRLVLVGRTSPREGENAFDLAMARNAARNLLGPNASLAQIGAHVQEQQRSAEAAQTLRALRDLGAEVDYVRADVSQAGELARVIAHAKARFGRTDWIIHGAGIDHSHEVRSASQPSLPVLRTKLQALDDATLASAPEAKWIVFSSVSAVYGNPGQVEYAAANEAMARVVLERGGLVMDFGPWRDVGMAASLHALFKSRGVDGLPGEAAARTAVRLIQAGAVGEHMICGRLGRGAGLLADRAATLDLDVPGAQYSASVDLEYDQAAWLRDHRWQGVGLLPGVVSLSMMVEAARRLEPTAQVSVIRSFSLREPVFVRPGGRQGVSVEAERTGRDDDGRDCGLVVATKVERGGHPIHSAEITFGAKLTDPVTHETCAPSTTRSVAREELYSRFFHGSSFQVLDSVQICPEQAVGSSIPLEQSLGIDMPAETRYVALAREVALQTAGAYLLFESSVIALPEGFDTCHVYADASPGERICADIRYRASPKEAPVFEALIRGEGGRLLERIQGLRFRRVSSSEVSSEEGTA